MSVVRVYAFRRVVRKQAEVFVENISFELIKYPQHNNSKHIYNIAYGVWTQYNIMDVVIRDRPGKNR